MEKHPAAGHRRHAVLNPSALPHELPQEEAAQKVAEAEQQLGELSQEVQQYRDLNERYRQISEENRQLYNTVQVQLWGSCGFVLGRTGMHAALALVPCKGAAPPRL